MDPNPVHLTVTVTESFRIAASFGTRLHMCVYVCMYVHMNNIAGLLQHTWSNINIYRISKCILLKM
jgi:hypothetical protein